MSTRSLALSTDRPAVRHHPVKAVGIMLIIGAVTLAGMAMLPEGWWIVGLVGVVLAVGLGRDAWMPKEDNGELPVAVGEVLQPNEQVEWSVPMSFSHDNSGSSWSSSRLYFTNQRLLWNVCKRGLFRKRLTYDDMPYMAIVSTDRVPMHRSKKGGALVVSTTLGRRLFGFDDKEKLQETDRVFRQLLLMRGHAMQSM